MHDKFTVIDHSEVWTGSMLNDQVARLAKLSKPTLSFPMQFLNVASMFAHSGATVNGRPAANVARLSVQDAHAVAAAEAAVGLAIIIAIFRHRQTVNLQNINVMKG